MTFNSVTFLFFAAVFYSLYVLVQGRLRLWLIFLASALFYGWWDWRFLGLIGLCIAVDFTAGILMAGTDDEKRRKRIMITSITINLVVLGFFKYFGFFVTSFADMVTKIGFTAHLPTLNILLPVGISFYTFQSMSYTIDVYRRVMEPERSLLRYSAFVLFFPQLVAGPIVRADLLLPQFRRDQPLLWKNFIQGVGLIIWGFFMKVAVADTAAPIVDKWFAHPEKATSLTMLVAVFLYAFQIYGDFSGYSGIAIGLARILGFDLGVNFNRPYFSRGFSEFWKRWHISLSSWLRDYLYIPLGGNRGGKWKTRRNLMLTMLLGGLWHGANWTFIVWGALHGGYLVVQQMLGASFRRLAARLRVPNLAVDAFLMLLVFSLTCFAWIFFRAQSFGDAVAVIERIVLFDGKGPMAIPLRFDTVRALALISFAVVCEVLALRVVVGELLLRRPVVACFSGACLIWTISLFGTFANSSFIYFQF
jgi:D-alanyl-lipoteichoic acid acyltransferase DltB (MBOAT superfamily)